MPDTETERWAYRCKRDSTEWNGPAFCPLCRSRDVEDIAQVEAIRAEVEAMDWDLETVT